MHTDKRTEQLVLTAVFAALTFVATVLVRIPVPGGTGYVHIGDALVILCGIFLGKKRGFLAAGIGSCLADLLAGYVIYIPVTFVIKGVVALLCAIAFAHLGKNAHNKKFALVSCGIIDIIIVAGGYALFETFAYGAGAAIPGILPNVGQGCVGLVLGCILYPIVRKAFSLRRA